MRPDQVYDSGLSTTQTARSCVLLWLCTAFKYLLYLFMDIAVSRVAVLHQKVQG
jgi:hypothetical protein